MQVALDAEYEECWPLIDSLYSATLQRFRETELSTVLNMEAVYSSETSQSTQQDVAYQTQWSSRQHYSLYVGVNMRRAHYNTRI